VVLFTAVDQGIAVVRVLLVHFSKSCQY